MTAFALGAETPILVLAYGSRQAILARRDWMARIPHWQAFDRRRPASDFMFTRLGKVAETSLTRAMPNWLVTVTAPRDHSMTTLKKLLTLGTIATVGGMIRDGRSNTFQRM